MLKRLKDWLIKRLGGYTEEERLKSVQCISERFGEEQRCNVLAVNCERTFTEMICCAGKDRLVESEKRFAALQLVEEIYKYIDWAYHYDPVDYKCTVRGRVYILLKE